MISVAEIRDDDRTLPVEGTYLAKGNLDSNDYAERNGPLRYGVNLQDDDNLITSLVVPTPNDMRKKHKVLLDLDVPAKLIPSTTEGHSHLYIDIEVEDDKYIPLLKVLADVGIIEPGYAVASERRGHTSLRLPWVKKEGNSPNV
jgi:hypothetical protein